jgi:hypothetical protein
VHRRLIRDAEFRQRPNLELDDPRLIQRTTTCRNPLRVASIKKSSKNRVRSAIPSATACP